MHPNKGKIAKLDADDDVTLEEIVAAITKDAKAQGRLEESQSHVYHIDLEHADKVLSMHDDEAEPAELKVVIEVVTTTKLMTEVVTTAVTTIIVALITAAPSATRKIKGVVIRDPKEIATPSVIVHSKPKSKDKGKGMSYDDIRPIFEKHFNSIMAFLEKGKKDREEEVSKEIKRKTKTSKEKAAKKQKLDEEVEELKTHLQMVPNDEDDVYTEATPLALKLFLSFISMLRNFDREDLEMLWKVVQERFVSSKPKNSSDDFLLNTLKLIFKKHNVEAYIWKNQRGSYGLAKVKSWKLLESCGVHIITFTTTQMILLVERIYPLTRFTLDQRLNNVRLEVEEESKVSLELLRFMRRQQQKDFKEYTLRDYYCWLKTYYYWYKLKLLDDIVGSRLRLLEETVVADEKMKILH
nr:hypothetical protein [Tanacetum cinerariifolium]